jgi:DNA-binding LacI/PurR family transcriptional regulator
MSLSPANPLFTPSRALLLPRPSARTSVLPQDQSSSTALTFPSDGTPSLTVGVIVHSRGAADSHFQERVFHALDASVSAGGGCVTRLKRGSGTGRSVCLETILNALEAAGARGFVFVEDAGESEPGGILTTLRRGRPAVWVSPRPTLLGVPTVSYDNDYAGYLAALHLIETGCRRIVFPYPENVLTDAALREEFSWLVQRLEGAERACTRNGGKFLPLPLTPPRDASNSPRAFWTALGRAAGESMAFWVNGLCRAGIIAPNDWFALALRSALSARGFPAGPPARTPAHYSLIGFDNIAEAAEAGLSSIEPPVETLGQQAAGLMLRLLRAQDASGDGRAAPPDIEPHISIRPTLLPRLTTRTR